MSRAEFKIGDVSATLDENGVRAAFHVKSVEKVEHYPKSVDCHEFNIVRFQGREDTVVSVYLDTSALVDLIEKAQAALDADVAFGCGEV